MVLPSRSANTSEETIEEFWDWFAVALFLLTTVDLVTTVYAAHVVGLDAEANPFMQWLLTTNVTIIAGIHLTVIVAATLLFRLLVGRLDATTAPYAGYFWRLFEFWLGLLCAAGLVVFANNLWVIFFGSSLF